MSGSGIGGATEVGVIGGHGTANLPDPHVLAEEIADDLRSALEQIEDVLADLQERAEVVGAED